MTGLAGALEKRAGNIKVDAPRSAEEFSAVVHDPEVPEALVPHLRF